VSLGTQRAPDPPSPAAGLACEHLSSGYRDMRVLHDITFSIRQPGVYVVLGPNGAGKTTLFRTLAGILRPSAGSILIDGLPVEDPGARDRLHFLSHLDGIPEGLRVGEAIEYYAAMEGAAPEDVDRVVGLLGLEALRPRFFSELSAGQKKRVSIARIFLRERPLYLLDEPTANLDPKVAGEIRELLLSLSRDRIVLYSSHNLFEAREIGTYVVALKAGRLALFGRISDLRTAKYTVGVRAARGEEKLPTANKRGESYVFELSGPDEVAKLLADLQARGVQVREVKEMGNPLEELFT
jgi:ABC-2 type transport system ATP-binding protein